VRDDAHRDRASRPAVRSQFVRIQSYIFNHSAQSNMPEFTYVVLTNPVPGREAEFNDWYTNTHVPDVLRVPGIKSAQRFRRTTQQRRPGPQPYEYLAVFQCEAAAPEVVTRELDARRAMMLKSDAVLEERLACYFEPITPIMSAESGK